jgi:hypothetical protein
MHSRHRTRGAAQVSISDEAPTIWHDAIVHIPSGDAVAEMIYNMERTSRDYSLPQKYVAGVGE